MELYICPSYIIYIILETKLPPAMFGIRIIDGRGRRILFSSSYIHHRGRSTTLIVIVARSRGTKLFVRRFTDIAICPPINRYRNIVQEGFDFSLVAMVLACHGMRSSGLIKPSWSKVIVLIIAKKLDSVGILPKHNKVSILDTVRDWSRQKGYHIKIHIV